MLLIHVWVISTLVCKKIKYVFEIATLYLEDFSIRALSAGNSCEVFVLNIKYFGPESSCCSELVLDVFPIVAFGAAVFCVFHSIAF